MKPVDNLSVYHKSCCENQETDIVVTRRSDRKRKRTSDAEVPEFSFSQVFSDADCCLLTLTHCNKLIHSEGSSRRREVETENSKFTSSSFDCLVLIVSFSAREIVRRPSLFSSSTMFAICHLWAWTKDCFEYLIDDFNSRLTYKEVDSACENAADVVRRLSRSRKRLEERLPNRTDAIRLADDVLQALREDHGGVLPDEALASLCLRTRFNDRDIFSTPEEKEAIIRMWARWKDAESVEKRFWGLGIGQMSDRVVFDYDLNEYRVWQFVECCFKSAGPAKDTN